MKEYMIGEKTKRLQVLQKAGFNVPAFVAISSEDLTKDPEEIAERVRKEISAEKFAVRSSARAEDAEKNSMAGKFLTKLDVSRNDLEGAIEVVCDDAKKKLGSLSEFSLLIQEFIEADVSGIVFTRNPQGDRETIIEYFPGRGDAVVGGLVKPIREVFYRTQKELTSKLPNVYNIKETFLAIENVLDFPQDIEWCIKNGELCILQSRPITSLTKEHYQFLLRIEDELPKDEKYYFAKTAVCDVAPRASLETYALLERLYEQDGPVDRAYQSLGVAYTATNFLKIICGELYVDKEKELQSLFPAYSYFFTKEYRPLPVRLRGFLTSLKNTRALKKCEGNHEEIALRARKALEKDLEEYSPEEVMQEFMKEYVLIFTINLFAESAVTKLKKKLPAKLHLAEALTYFPKNLSKIWEIPEDIVGNTLEFSDTSPFVTRLQQQESEHIPPTIPLQELSDAQELLRLREYGRWIALRYITKLREFLSVEREGFEEEPAPVILTDVPILVAGNRPQGVSGGIGKGEVTRIPKPGGILVVSALTPDIAEHADMLKGVIADHGGLLSHFAIIAREIGLPVVVNYPIAELKEGLMVTIDGSTGEVILGME